MDNADVISIIVLILDIIAIVYALYIKNSKKEFFKEGFFKTAFVMLFVGMICNMVVYDTWGTITNTLSPYEDGNMWIIMIYGILLTPVYTLMFYFIYNFLKKDNKFMNCIFILISIIVSSIIIDIFLLSISDILYKIMY